MMKVDFLRKILFSRTCLGCVLGMIGGYAYYYFIGCQSGSCPITSNPYISVLYGALLGGVLFYKPRKKSESNTNEINQNT